MSSVNGTISKMAASPETGTVLYWNSSYANVDRSTDNGESWSTVRSNNNFNSASYGAGTWVMVSGTSSGAVYTLDDGHTWQSTQNDVRDKVTFGSDLFLSFNNADAYVSDNGKSWSKLSSASHAVGIGVITEYGIVSGGPSGTGYAAITGLDTEKTLLLSGDPAEARMGWVE
ncbi:hypothetical protein [Vreelandella lionensis]|uniref:hypothetical protein n=1 Tax=Vreelandella lionensis TaxID=1144478 RepID=UPI00111BF5CF|nr:hypothetical protein [Halomonas lionensis]